jgi:hypothetical protein
MKVTVEDVGYGVRIQTHEGPYNSVDVLLTPTTAHLAGVTARVAEERVLRAIRKVQEEHEQERVSQV